MMLQLPGPGCLLPSSADHLAWPDMCQILTHTRYDGTVHCPAVSQHESPPTKRVPLCFLAAWQTCHACQLMQRDSVSTSC